MYAIIETGGKQYRVAEGDVLYVERLPEQPDETVTFDRVLAVGSGKDLKVGAPVVEGSQVVARVIEHGRGKKLRIFTYKSKKNVRRRLGHRQAYTKVRIETIKPA